MTDTSLPSGPIKEYIEAISTWSVRYLDPSGFECILSIQAGTGSEALQKAEGALSHLSEAKCIPIRKNSQNSTENNNGKHANKTVMVKTDGKNPICPIHGIEMKQWSKNGRTWYSHRWNDGWCDGKKS